MKIKTYEDGSARLLWDWRDIALTTADFKTLRAFFQAERDEELGRWRDPENPDYVVYPLADGTLMVMLFNEQSQYRGFWSRKGTRECVLKGGSADVARRYFAAHPEPKPWDAAKPDCDEIWVLTIHGCEQPVYVTEFRGEPVFQVPDGETISPHRKSITAGRRIWPEGEASDQ